MSNERMPHALLLSGAEGLGKAYLAKLLIRRLLCHSPNDTEACGVCKSCLLLDAETHLDCHSVAVADDAKSILIGQIRDLTSYITDTPQLGSWKVAVVHDADKMNLSASNALLKGLEEPPQNTLLILVSNRPYSILPTVRSRCQIWSVDAPSMEQSVQWLRDAGVDDNDAQALLSQTGCNPFLAWRWYSAGEYQSRTEVSEIIAQVAEGEMAAIDAADRLAEMDARDSIEVLMGLVHRKSLETLAHSGNRSASADGQNALKIYTQFFNQLLGVHREITSSVNPQLKLLWENVLLRWQSLQYRLDTTD